MKRFAELLRKETEAGLPGTAVQMEMSSIPAHLRNSVFKQGADAIDAAVLILLYPLNNTVHTVLMQRPDYDGIHGGQISFPGGKKEPSDENIIETALREAHEEAGIDRSLISVINTLTPLYIPVSRMLVTPVLAWTPEKPQFEHHPGEVEFLFDVELTRLNDNSIIKTVPMIVRGQPIDVKHYDYDGKVIWGATAMILRELLVLIERGWIPLTVA
jgi:8-oxo-dGTP pyrophosphatase MutT (NUDIX family)